MALSGTASDDVLVTSVTWVNDRGGSGTATGTTSWSEAGVALFEGVNVVTVTAHDGDGGTGTDILTVTLDTIAPVVTITGPTSSPTYSTTNSTLQLNGTTSDTGTGVAGAFWTSTELGQSGSVITDLGLSPATWVTTGLVLLLGTNTITISVFDVAGNVGTDTITITLTTGGLAAFPTTPILFSGVHANEDPLSVGGNFAGPVSVGHSQLKIVSNKVQGGTSGTDATRADSYWNTTTSAPTRDECYCTIPTVPITEGTGVELFLRVVSPNTSGVTSYSIQVFASPGGPLNQYRYRRSGVTIVGTFVGPTLIDGDSFGLSMDGQQLQAWIKQEPDDWVPLDAGLSDNTYPLGTGTLAWRVDPTELAVTNLGGGKGQAPAVVTHGPMRSGAW